MGFESSFRLVGLATFLAFGLSGCSGQLGLLVDIENGELKFEQPQATVVGPGEPGLLDEPESSQPYQLITNRFHTNCALFESTGPLEVFDEGDVYCFGSSKPLGEAFGFMPLLGYTSHPRAFVDEFVSVDDSVEPVFTKTIPRIAVGLRHALMLKRTKVSSEVYALGSNDASQLGVPTKDLLASEDWKSVELENEVLEPINVMAGPDSSCVTFHVDAVNNRHLCWGDNTNNKLGVSLAGKPENLEILGSPEVLLKPAEVQGKLKQFIIADKFSFRLYSAPNMVHAGVEQLYFSGVFNGFDARTEPQAFRRYFETKEEKYKFPWEEEGEAKGLLPTIAEIAIGGISKENVLDHEVFLVVLVLFKNADGYHELSRIYGMGANQFAQVGIGHPGESGKYVPKFVEIKVKSLFEGIYSGISLLRVAAGQDHACLVYSGFEITASETAACWGNNSKGQASAGPAMGKMITRPTRAYILAEAYKSPGGGVPEPVYAQGILDLSLGYESTCFVRLEVDGNQVYCAGKHQEGQLGLGDSLVPVGKTTNLGRRVVFGLVDDDDQTKSLDTISGVPGAGSGAGLGSGSGSLKGGTGFSQ